MSSCRWLLQQTACNVIGRLNFVAQKLEAKIESLVTVHCHAHRLALASCYTAADLYSIVRTKLQKHFNAFMEVFFDVAIGWPGDASNYNEDKRLAVAARMQNKVVVSEATVRARCEILGIWAALKQLS